MNCNFVRVEHWNGTIIRGIVTGGDTQGIWVQEADRLPVFCDFFNVKRIDFNAAA